MIIADNIEGISGCDIESIIEPNMEIVIESNIESIIEPNMEMVIESAIESDMEAAIETAIEPEIESAIEPEIDHVTAFDPGIERVELDIVATGAEIDVAFRATDISAVKGANSFDELSVSPALIEVTDLSDTDVGTATGY
ncbi:unnamed protein product [Ambrosiozyma monospora]|uniref:Unnamed protein product n=1 Tax=Ambrosiozyma monospora TaxID=43982 RepID=A0A9W6SYM9_AMBMO|nr:unnamed protein product [Ambrosiozyma monospora]